MSQVGNVSGATDPVENVDVLTFRHKVCILIEEMPYSASDPILTAAQFPHLLHEQAAIERVLVVQRFLDLLSSSHTNKITFVKLARVSGVRVPLQMLNRLTRFFTVKWVFFWNKFDFFEPGLLPQTKARPLAGMRLARDSAMTPRIAQQNYVVRFVNLSG